MADKTTPLRKIEGWLEAILFASRWILAPFYLGLALSLIVLLIKFVAELGHIAAHAFTATESEVILGVLALVDLALTGSLIVIVIFSGYENFVSRIDHGDHKDWPEWMGKIDFSALKLKLLSSIVAISAIQLLKQFMSINTVSDRDVMWLVIMHVVFVVSSVFLALSDRIAGHGDGGHGKSSSGGGSHEKAAATTNAPPAATPQAAHGHAALASASFDGTTNPGARIKVTRVEICKQPAGSAAPRATTPVRTDNDIRIDRPRVELTAQDHEDEAIASEHVPVAKRRLH